MAGAGVIYGAGEVRPRFGSELVTRSSTASSARVGRVDHGCSPAIISALAVTHVTGLCPSCAGLHELIAGNPFTLVESTFIQPRTSAQPGFLSLRVAIDGTRMNLVDRQDVQVILAASFGFDPLGGCKERDTAATGLIPGFGAASA